MSCTEEYGIQDHQFWKVWIAFKSVKCSKAAEHDDIDSNVIIQVYDEISYPLFIIFYSSLNEGIFPEKVANVAKVSLIFKIGNIEAVVNYRPISVLPIFSKVLERIMYNNLSVFQRKRHVFPETIWLSSE